MATVGGIGVGLLILIVIWVFTLTFGIILSRAQGAVAFGSIGLVLLAVVITLILAFLPRGPPEIGKDYIIYDDSYMVRTAMASVIGIMAFFGVCSLVIHLFDPQLATPLKTRRGI